MKCRPGCGACCIAPSISSPIPGMPNGKPSGIRCIHLNNEFKCDLFGKPERPAVCGNFAPELLFCGQSRIEALSIMFKLEDSTQ